MDNKIKISFLGDISLNDNYNRLYEIGENPFKEVGELLQDSDLVVGNLECFAQSDQGENLLKKPRLKTNIKTLNYLKDIHLGLACLANNHVYDNLEEGFLMTTAFLDSNGIKRMGASMVGDESEPYIFEKSGIKIAILNYITHDTNPNIPTEAKVKPNWFWLKKAIQDIKNVRSQVHHIVVYPHWGGVMEGSMFPDRELIPIAHKLVDAGADLIIGHHPHTLQPFEKYQGKYIFYSIGNFCFSDMFYDGSLHEMDTWRRIKSAILLAEFDSDFIRLYVSNIKNIQNVITVSLKNNDIDQTSLLLKSKWFNNNMMWSLYSKYEKKIYPVINYLFMNKRNPIKQIAKLELSKVARYILR